MVLLDIMSNPSLSRGTDYAFNGTGSNRIVRAWVEPVLCFILPLSTVLFLSTGPHAWDVALLWTLPVWLCVAADYFSPSDQSTPKQDGLGWLLDARLYVLFSLQLGIIFLALDLVSNLAWETPSDLAMNAANLVAIRVLVGTNSCCSALAVAHELLHRRAKHRYWMGRILLWTVCYDHFALEHAHGHHRRVCTSADPATARYGESFASFCKRSMAGQWANAWLIEGRRLRHRSGLAVFLHHRVLHGLAFEIGILILIIQQFGCLALMVFLYQAMVALRMLEAVNYLQHWGLTRSGAKSPVPCAWTTDSWFTLHTFLGLSRHAAHHAHAGLPSHKLWPTTEGPKLPHGYFVMVLMLRFSNRAYIELASRELKEKGLA